VFGFNQAPDWHFLHLQLAGRYNDLSGEQVDPAQCVFARPCLSSLFPAANTRLRAALARNSQPRLKRFAQPLPLPRLLFKLGAAPDVITRLERERLLSCAPLCRQRLLLR
jgi:hypothetical protein